MFYFQVKVVSLFTGCITWPQVFTEKNVEVMYNPHNILKNKTQDQLIQHLHPTYKKQTINILLIATFTNKTLDILCTLAKAFYF